MVFPPFSIGKVEQFMLSFTYIAVAAHQFLFRRPALDGDNWWRGHAAAFLRFVNIAPTALVRGRVRQVMPYFFCNT